MTIRLALLGALVTLSGNSCGESGDDDDGAPGRDAGSDAADDASVQPDAGPDASPDAGPALVTLTGRVLGEEIDGVAPPIDGATVSLLGPAGAVVATGESDAGGAFALDAALDDVAFLLVDAVGEWVGQLRAQQSRDGLAFYDVYLQSAAGVERSYGYVGLDVDPARGTVAVGFNPADPALGGEGARLAAGPEHDPAFVLIEDGAIASDVLPPVCPNEGAVACTDVPRSNNVFIPNVEPGPVGLELIQPQAGTCAVRFPRAEWLVLPRVSTIVDVDCQP